MNVTVKVDVPGGQVIRQSLGVSSFGYQDPKSDLEGGKQVEARIWNSAAMRADGELVASNIKDVIAAPRSEKSVIWAASSIRT
jgi:hypothetical protein